MRRADVLNRGYGGYNTRWALEALPHIFKGQEARPPLLVVVFFGANDASLAAHNERQHIPLQEYHDNLIGIAQELRALWPKVRLLFVGPPPVAEAQRLAYAKERYAEKARGVLERTEEAAGEYAAACERAAQKVGIPSLSLWGAMRQARPDGSWSEFLRDGLHLSRRGDEFVAKAVLGAIEQHYPELSVVPCRETQVHAASGSRSELPVQLPWGDKISNSDYRAISAAAHDQELNPAGVAASGRWADWDSVDSLSVLLLLGMGLILFGPSFGVDQNSLAAICSFVIQQCESCLYCQKALAPLLQ